MGNPDFTFTTMAAVILMGLFRDRRQSGLVATVFGQWDQLPLAEPDHRLDVQHLREKSL